MTNSFKRTVCLAFGILKWWLWVSGFPIDGRAMLDDALKSFSTCYCCWKWTAAKMPMKMTRTESWWSHIHSQKPWCAWYPENLREACPALVHPLTLGKDLLHCVIVFCFSTLSVSNCPVSVSISLLPCSGSLSLSLPWPCTTATLWAVASFLLRVLPTKQFGTIWNNNMITLNAQCPP